MGKASHPFLAPTAVPLKQGELAELCRGLSALSWAPLVTAGEADEGRMEAWGPPKAPSSGLSSTETHRKRRDRQAAPGSPSSEPSFS